MPVVMVAARRTDSEPPSAYRIPVLGQNNTGTFGENQMRICGVALRAMSEKLDIGAENIRCRQWGYGGANCGHQPTASPKLLKRMVDAVGIEPTTPPV